MISFKNSIQAFFILVALNVFAQEGKTTWKNLAQTKDDNWYTTADAKRIAENVLLYQRDIGGWPKNIQMQDELSASDKEKLSQLKSDPSGCTIDNGATCQEMHFLSKVYEKQPNDQYKYAFLRGLMYLISAQYSNGGWPQFFPLKKGYYTHITYNDDAMVNVLKILKEIKEKGTYNSIIIPTEIQKQSAVAFDKGIDCILKTQYKQNGKLTVWCAQHDKETLLPAKARAYELPSLSGRESAKITLLLMSIDKPSTEIIQAVEAAVSWFEKTKIEGIKIESVPTGKEDETDRKVIESPGAEPLWARFMELDNNQPFFCDRDGIKKATLAEIGYERRNGYGWYTNEPKEVLKKYQSWKEKWVQ